MSELKAEKLKKRYKARTVVKDVSLDVSSGEVVGLLGPNGAGKTTCFYMMVGLVPLDGGDLFLDQQALTHMPIHRRARMGLSYLPQEASIFRKLTVAENIRPCWSCANSRKTRSASNSTTLLHDLHIAHLRNSPAISLSGGERRRVEIARALATQPRFICWTNRSPAWTRSPCWTSRRSSDSSRIAKSASLITDHNVRETLGICDRAYIINDGSVLACGKPEEIVYNESVRKVYLGEHFGCKTNVCLEQTPRLIRHVCSLRYDAMKHSLQLKLSQHLTLTPQLQQSIRLLQLSTLELNQEIETFLQENPLLERDEDGRGSGARPINGAPAATARLRPRRSRAGARGGCRLRTSASCPKASGRWTTVTARSAARMTTTSPTLRRCRRAGQAARPSARPDQLHADAGPRQTHRRVSDRQSRRRRLHDAGPRRTRADAAAGTGDRARKI